MNELNSHVERVVRPIRARPGRKARMRRELLAHLTGIYDEERASLGDDRLALAQAVRRFGDPAELTRELQATVPRVERWLFAEASGPHPLPWLDVQRAGREALRLLTEPGRFSVRAALRVSARCTAILLASGLAAGTLGAAFALAAGDGPIRPGRGVGVLLGFSAYAFAAIPFGLGVVRYAFRGPSVGSAVRAAGFAAGLLLLGAGIVPVLGLAQPDNPLWDYLIGSPDRWAATAAVLAGWVLLPAAAVKVNWYFERSATPAALPEAAE